MEWHGAGADRRQEEAGLTRRQDESRRSRRLFEQLEQRVGGLRTRLLRDEQLGIPDNENLTVRHGRA